MNQTPSMNKIEFFLRNVFDYLDRYTEFTERPMSDERHWIGVDAPIIQLIFMDDVVAKRPITANYVTLFVTGQVFTLEQYVDACVKVIQALREEDLPDIVIEYVNNLVECYAQSIGTLTPARPERVEAALRTAAEEASTPELDDDTAIEEPPAPVEEESPHVEEPVDESTLAAPGLSAEESNGWK